MIQDHGINLKIWGAQTLTGFTDCISKGMKSIGFSFDASVPFAAGLAQIHGSPQSKAEDLKILNEALRVNFPVVYLIHRPDEILENQNLLNTLSELKSARFVLLGDLVFKLPFWSERRINCAVIPHPFMDVSLPPSGDRVIVGSFTSWGEMRKLDHYVSLVERLRGKRQFEFKIGGSGIEKTRVPLDVQISPNIFVPHFNVQLYHLNGRKRIGESSGSLHRGISIPVIFEANGAERLENIKVVKIKASEDLSQIDFDEAAVAISRMVQSNLSLALEHNLRQAESNTPLAFAHSLLSVLRT